jgi:hypothetical protein
LQKQAGQHNCEFHYLMGANEARFLNKEQFKSFARISEPIGTMINKNIFVHAGISLNWAKRPLYLPTAKAHVKEGKMVTVDSLGHINNEANKILSTNPLRKSRPIFNELDNGPLYNIQFEEEGKEEGDACHELIQVLKILGVSFI